jgi:hypothetical protein
MGFTVVTEEPSSREVGDVIIMGDTRSYMDPEVVTDDARHVDLSAVTVWNTDAPDVDKEGNVDEEDLGDDDEEEDDDEDEEDDEADAEAEDDDTDSERS